MPLGDETGHAQWEGVPRPLADPQRLDTAQAGVAYNEARDTPTARASFSSSELPSPLIGLSSPFPASGPGGGG